MPLKSEATSAGMLCEKRAFSPSSSTSQPMTVERVGPGVFAAGANDGGRRRRSTGSRPPRRRRTARFATMLLFDVSFLRRSARRARPPGTAPWRRDLALAMSAARERPEHAAGAAQAEDRQALDVAPKTHLLDHQRIEAGGWLCRWWRDDDHVDLVLFQLGLVQKLKRDLFEERDGIVDIELGALCPAVLVRVPTIGTQE